MAGPPLQVIPTSISLIVGSNPVGGLKLYLGLDLIDLRSSLTILFVAYILSSSGPGPRSGPGQVPGQVQKVQGLRTKDLDLG